MQSPRRIWGVVVSLKCNIKGSCHPCWACITWWPFVHVVVSLAGAWYERFFASVVIHCLLVKKWWFLVEENPCVLPPSCCYFPMKSWGGGRGAPSRTSGAVHGELLLSIHGAASQRRFPAVTQPSRLLHLLSQMGKNQG